MGKKHGHHAYTRQLTNVNMKAASVWTVLLSGATLASVYFLLPDGRAYAYLFERGLLPIIIVLFSSFALSILILKFFKIQDERKAFALSDNVIFKTNATESHITVDESEMILNQINSLPDDQKELMLVERIQKAAQRLKNTKSSTELDNILNTLSEIDANIIDSSYTGVKFMAGVIPILGFLGTVYGISIAITTFTQVLENASSFEAVKPALNLATTNLGIAFDTTFLALIGSGLILLVNAAMQKKEEDLLSAIDGYCVDKLVSRLRVISSDIAELIGAVNSSTEQIVGAVEGQSQYTKKVADNMDDMRTTIDETSREVNGGVKEMKDAVLEVATDEVVESLLAIADIVSFMENVRENTQEIVKNQRESTESIHNDIQDLISQQEKPVQELQKVVDQMVDLPEKLEPLKGLGASFEGLKDMSGAFEKFKGSLDELKPAIQSLSEDLRPAIEGLSEEMAGKVNEILVKLLKVNVIANKLDEMPEREKEHYKNIDLMAAINPLIK